MSKDFLNLPDFLQQVLFMIIKVKRIKSDQKVHEKNRYHNPIVSIKIGEENIELKRLPEHRMGS